MKMAKSGHFYILLDTPTPRRRSARLGVELRLAKPKSKFSEFSSPPKCSNAPPRRTSPPRRSIALPRRTCKSCFGSSLPLILTIIHLINEDPNK